MESVKRLLRTIGSNIGGDKVIWLLVLFISMFSLLAVYSSTGTLAFKAAGARTEPFLFKHFALLIFGLIMMFVAHNINYRYYSRISQLLLWLSVPLLIVTLFFGTDLNDAKRWITLPGIQLTFQTSDLAKLALIMYTARLLSRKQDQLANWKEGFLPILYPVVIICGLIAPADLSTAAMLFVTCLILMFIGRVKVWFIAKTIGSGIIAVVLMISLLTMITGENRFKTWQQRGEAFISGENDTYSQARQSQIAVATAGVFGKGPGNSTQRNFLPHPYSDFIFAIIIEEYGLFGASILLFFYLAFLYRSIRIVIKSPGAFGALLAVGLSISLVFQALLNMAVNVSLLPVTGLPLPLVSMGGTSLLFSSMAIGIILSVSRFIEDSAETGLSTSENVAA